MKSSLLLRLTALRLKPAVMDAVCAIIDEIEAPIEARKAKDRDRKPRKIRGNSSENPRTIHGNSTPVSVENPPTVSLQPSINKQDSLNNKNSFLLTSSDSTLEKKEVVVIARERKSRAKGQIVPESMKLSIKNLEFALSKGLTRQAAFEEWERYKDGSISKGRAYQNIDAGWRNWMRSPFLKGTGNGQQTRNSGNSRESSILAAARDVAARRFGVDKMAGSGDGMEFPDWDNYEGDRTQRRSNGSGSHTEDPGCEQSGSTDVRQGEIIPPDEGANGFFSGLGTKGRD